MSTTQEKRNSVIKDLKNLLIWISIALIIRWQVIEPRWIPSGSMLPTLQIQDKILVEKLTPKITSKSNLSKLKNKIVVFNVPEQLINAGYEADTALIKRVIGIPGDKVEVRDGNLYLNDIAQNNYVLTKTVGINVFFLHYLLLTCLSLAAVVGLQSVGIILVVAMLITPGATAYLLTDKFDNMTVISVLSAIISSLIGIYVSFWFDLETGGSIVLAQTFIFLFAFLFAPRYGIIKLKKLFDGYK